MQLVTLLSIATAMVATSANTIDWSQETAVTLQSKFASGTGAYAGIVNRCPYPVYVWHVMKGQGCPLDAAVVLKTGDSYRERYPTQAQLGGSAAGVSVKISKESQCKGSGITQLEYFLQFDGDYKGNYLDVSYVDCEDGQCPTRQEGFYMQAGDQTNPKATAAQDNHWCPVLKCSDSASCSKLAYVLPDDVQTKTCNVDSNIDFYLCGSEAPSGDGYAHSNPASSSSNVASSAAPKQTTLVKVPTSAVQKVQVAEVTKAPLADIKNIPKVLTVVEVVTAYQTINAKRHEHAHAHARRHQPFNA